VNSTSIRSFWKIWTAGLALFAMIAVQGCELEEVKDMEKRDIVQHVRYSIKPGKLEAYLPILAELETATRRMPGVLSYQH